MRTVITKRRMVLFPNLQVGTTWNGFELEKGVTAKKADNWVVLLSAPDPHNRAMTKEMPCFCGTFGKTSDQFLDEIEKLNKKGEAQEYDFDAEH